MKKRVFTAVMMVLAIAALLCACKQASADAYDTGLFSVSVPSGWKAFPQSDIFGAKDESGNYPVDTRTILLGKGTEDEAEAMKKANIRINFYETAEPVTQLRTFYDNVADIPNVKINGTECEAFSGESLGYTYEFITYLCKDGTFQIQILTSADGENTGIAWGSAEVKQILESLDVNREGME